jgi:hypothetical protein
MESRARERSTKSKSPVINFGEFSQAVLPTWLSDPVAMGLWGRVVTYDILSNNRGTAECYGPTENRA